MTKGTRLSSPWVCYFRELEALFTKDPAVRLEFDEENYTIKLYVEGPAKAEALERLLPAEKTFGNVTVHTNVIPANLNTENMLSLFKTAFEGNPAFSFGAELPSVMSNDVTYIVFKKEVVQYYNDDLGDINGMKSTLYQDIAKDVFSETTKGVFFCTDTVEEFM